MDESEYIDRLVYEEDMDSKAGGSKMTNKTKGIITCTFCGASAAVGAEIKHSPSCRLLTDEELDKWCLENCRYENGVCAVSKSCAICGRKAQLAKALNWEEELCANCDTPLLREGELQQRLPDGTAFRKVLL